MIEVEYDKNQVLSNSNVQASGSHDQVQASASKFKQVLVMTECKINNKWLVHHLNQMSNQVQQSNSSAPTN